ncbi:MAG: neuraminidase-like domain-containing protein [Blastocatellia bacterium]
MRLRIQVVKLNDRSKAVADLHTAMRELGLTVHADEIDEQHAGDSTLWLMREWQSSMNITPREDFLVDEKTAEAMNRLFAEQGLQAAAADGEQPFVVHGVVTYPDGRPARSMPVTAFDQDMRFRQELGRTITDSNGEYLIRYSLSAFTQAEAGSADLVIEVYAPLPSVASGAVLHTTEIRYNAPRDIAIDISLAGYGSEAEFDLIARELSPLLAEQHVTFDTLEENEALRDITFAAGETGIPHDRLMAFALAHHLLALTHLSAEFWFAALRTHVLSEATPKPDSKLNVRQRAEAVWHAIPRTPASVVEQAVIRASDSNIIARPTTDQRQEWLNTYKNLSTTEAATGEHSNARSLLDAASISDAPQRAAFLEAYLSGGSRDDLLRRIRNSPVLAGQAANLETSLILNDLTLGDDKLLKGLKLKIADPARARDLARMTTAQWQAAIDQASAKPPEFVAGQSEADRQRNYAALLASRAALAYPTAAFAGGLTRASSAGHESAFEFPAQIVNFLDTHTDFELASTSIDGYLRGKPLTTFVAAAATEAFVTELKAAQRVFKLVANFDATNALLSGGLHSAQHIYRMGESKFVNEFASKPGFTEQLARDTYQRAANTHAAVVTIVGDLRATLNANDVQSLANLVPALEDFPNLANLFGKADVCECEQCRSIFSPAAYLADLLMYVAARRAIAPTVSVKQVLFERRPDIGTIELSCENSNTPLPYIDLVCEVLEDRVASWKLFDLDLNIDADFKEGPITNSPKARTALANATPSVKLSDAAVVTKKDKSNARVIRDANVTYRASGKAGPPAKVAVSLLRQTRGSADELAANPEYVNESAYAALRDAKRPLALPFDLATEEVRAYLQQVSIRRADLMELFRGPAAPASATAIDIAAESIGIARFEQDLIFKSNKDNQFTYWGRPGETPENNQTVIAAMTRVDAFLDRTGLEYTDLLRLLSLNFVNPNSTVKIKHLDSSCDTSQKEMQGLDDLFLDRLRRFLRLWRKLGWKMWEVDFVIQHTALGNGTLDTNFVLRLYPFLKLKERFSDLTVEQLGAFFSDLNTTGKFSEAFHKPEPSLYESLFLNKRLTNPLDPAFAIEAVQSATPTETIDAHLLSVLAATRTRETDLAILRRLTSPGNGPAYLKDNKLSLSNLSFLYRHALLLKRLAVNPADWQTLLFIVQQDAFRDPATTLAVIGLVDRLQSSGFTIDDLSYLLTANLNTKAAEPEKNVTLLLTTLRAGLQAIAAASDAASAPTDAEGLANAITAQLQTLGWDTASAGALIDTLNNRIQLQSVAQNMPKDFAFPDSITKALSIGYDKPRQTIRFIGVMTDIERDTLLGSALPEEVRKNTNYQAAIREIHSMPRLLARFYQPLFRAALPALPVGVLFGEQLPKHLADRIQYDSERHELSFFGIMSRDEKAAFEQLSPDGPEGTAYVNAIQALYDLPNATSVPAEMVWLQATDLVFASPLLHLAATRLAAYSKRRQWKDAAVAQLSDALQLTPAITEQLLTAQGVFGARVLLEYYLDPAFINSSSAITYAAYKPQYDGYYWLHRISIILRALQVTYFDLDWIRRNNARTGVLNPLRIPVVFDAGKLAIAPIEAFLNLVEYMQFHHARSNQTVSMLAIIDRLIADNTYTNALFGADVELLTGWVAADIEQLTAADGLAVTFPVAYRQIDAWQRLKKAVLTVQNLNASAKRVAGLAKSDLSSAEAAALKQMLRSKYDEKAWLDISKSLQDALRERKRDSLVAYLLAQKRPDDAPTGKWENANDLYGYNLIDVEMSSCQLTSRVVQASAAVQLFVQRCFMGLEPKVRVSAEEDDAWNQWKWMQQYRVWEANRRVFAYPENYAEPELRRDKSEIFRNLEDELGQNELNPDNVETAFLHYVERLDEVAQLEITGTYYQESTHTLHVFARTPGADPHIHYYRQFVDDRRWTPWVRVDCDIKSDFVVPVVHDERLYLIWPEFREVPNETGAVASEMTVPSPGATYRINQPLKQLNMHLAISEQRNKRWTPKKVSAQAVKSLPYTGNVEAGRCTILPFDFTWLDETIPFLLLIYSPVLRYDAPPELWQLAGCRGYPEPVEERFQGMRIDPYITSFFRDQLISMKNIEGQAGDPLTPWNSLILKDDILALTPGSFKISFPHYMSYLDRMYPIWEQIISGGQQNTIFTLGTFYSWFYADQKRTFFVRPEAVSARDRKVLFYQDVSAMVRELVDLLLAGRIVELRDKVAAYMAAEYDVKLWFTIFYHPLTCLFAKKLNTQGVAGLMARATQFTEKNWKFKDEYGPTTVVDAGAPQPGDPTPKYPREAVDFAPDGSYSSYNWELFFHAPLMIASRLSENQQFEEAMRWFHFIFDPTGAHDRDPITGKQASAPQKYWITKPFYLRQFSDYLQDRIENLLKLLADDPKNPTPPDLLQELARQVKDWRTNPFDPHLIAQFRTVAYQKMTVMKYIDNLIAWGDQQFRLDTMESVNTAAQLYILAAEILGPRPRHVPPPAKPPSATFNELEDRLDAFSNALVEFENLIPVMPVDDGSGHSLEPVPSLLFFCIPQNDQLLKYWDEVADRLYKIRHCLNIEGVARQLPLFAPPIDPGLLVKAAAAGIDIATAISDLDAPLPYYRFTTMVQKANEFTGDVKALGSALLAALEKRDAEAFARLRQRHETALLEAIREVKAKQIEEANFTLSGLQLNQGMAIMRRNYYQNLVSGGLIDPEKTALDMSLASTAIDTAIASGYVLAGLALLIAQFVMGATGVGGSPTATAEMGGDEASGMAEFAVKALEATTKALDKGAALFTTMAGYERRAQEWQHQLNLAIAEVIQIDAQIAAAQVRIAIAQRELANHDLQIAHARAVDDFMHRKYTNEELYQWMVGEVSQTYFRAYQLAYDLARRAEQCYRYEIGVEDSSYIQFGYWDSLKSGLQSGERLQLALRRLESAYLDQNRREFECIRHISLALLNPRSLVTLKDTGICMVDLPEELFDLDYAGHYFRRIKSVSISIPCVAGPYTTVNCTLRLLRNMVRVTSVPSTPYEHNSDNGVPVDDNRFRESHVRVQSIATSSGQNDSGMFELNFRDERYLPFEGAGAVSRWQIELTQDRKLRQFPYETISDVIIHMKYTAREDAGNFKAQAIEHLKAVIADGTRRLLQRFFDLPHEFATEWYAFFHPAAGAGKTLHLKIRKHHFPFFAQNANVSIKAITLMARTRTKENLVAVLDPPIGSARDDEIALAATTDPDAFHVGQKAGLNILFNETQGWKLRMKKGAGSFDDLIESDIVECYMIVDYTVS